MSKFFFCYTDESVTEMHKLASEDGFYEAVIDIINECNACGENGTRYIILDDEMNFLFSREVVNDKKPKQYALHTKR